MQYKEPANYLQITKIVFLSEITKQWRKKVYFQDTNLSERHKGKNYTVFALFRDNTDTKNNHSELTTITKNETCSFENGRTIQLIILQYIDIQIKKSGD